MIRVFIANARAEEISALRLMLLDLKMEVVGDASTWPRVLERAPKTHFNLLLIDWSVLPQNAIAGIAKLRMECADEIVVVLTSYLDARQQVALSTGADTFLSKSIIPNRLGDQLREVAHAFHMHEISNQSPKKIKEYLMNKNILEGRWKQIRGEARAWWGKLTDNDLDRVAGKFEVLVGLLQEKYGYTRQQATDEIDRRVTDYEAQLEETIRENK